MGEQSDPAAAKRAASALWLGRIDGVVAVGLGRDESGGPAIVVSYVAASGPPDLPDSFLGIPVIARPIPRPVTPLATGDAEG